MTWDQALMRSLRARGNRRWRAALPATLLAIGLVVGLLPGLAYAHFAKPGLNDAQLDLGPDDGETSPFGAQRTVTGKSFISNDVARIFECAYGATSFLNQCQPIGAAQTDSSGGFSAKLTMQTALVTPSGAVQCAGFAGPTRCAVAAATYDAFQQPTASAQHFICFQGPNPCDPPDEGTTTTTTTTTAPPQGPEWEPIAPMATARERLTAVVGADGRIYAMGGNNTEGAAFDSVEAYDPCTKRWSSVPPMPTPRTQFAAATGADGRIYVIGGNDRRWGSPMANVDVYDPGTATWSSAARLSLPRGSLAAATGPDGRIYAIGGTVPTEYAYAVPTVETYEPATDQWQFAAPLSRPRQGHDAVTGPNGRMSVVGSDPDATGSPSEVEYYSAGSAGTPATWQKSAAQYNLPWSLAATAGPDGRIYAIGGDVRAGSGGPRSLSIYEPVSDSWTASTEALTTARTNAAAALGRDGRIYAIGGTDVESILAVPPPTSSVEAMKVGPSLCPPPAADFDGDGDTDVSVFRPANGTWYVKDGASSPWGADGDVAVPADYDGDRKVDQAIFRPATGLWAIHGSAGVDTFVTYGISTDVPIPADYDGDGRADLAIYRPEFGTWWMRWSSTGADVAITFGIAGDVPVPADYDGDGRADLAIFRDGTWFTLPSSGGAYTATTYGAPGDIPVPGDYDADRHTDMAIFRPSDATWSLHHSSDGTDETFTFGAPGDVPQPGDYNGDGVYDPATFRAGQWFVETGETYQWGIGTDIPLPLPAAVRMASAP